MKSTVRHAAKPARTRRAATVALLAISVPFVGGCFRTVDRPPEPVAAPTDNDPAYAFRQWPNQEATFANSTVDTYRNRFRYGFDREQEKYPYSAVVVTPFVSFVQTLILPISLLKYPPGSRETYSSLTYPPTYTAMPSRPDMADLPAGVGGAQPVQPSPPAQPAAPVAPTPSDLTPTPAPAPAPAPTPAPEPSPAPAPEAKPVEPTPAPADPKPTEPKPAEPKPAEPKATEVKPEEAKPAEPAPVDGAKPSTDSDNK